MFKVLGASLLAGSLILFAGATSASATCETDFNGDGVTDEADFEILKSSFGSVDYGDDFPVAVDLNADGAIDLADYNIFVDCN